MIVANPLFNGTNNPMNPLTNIIQQAQELKKTFTGNPRDEVQKLLNSGRMSQQQFNHYSQIAQQVVQAMGEDV
jgi:hypothetical protein